MSICKLLVYHRTQILMAITLQYLQVQLCHYFILDFFYNKVLDCKATLDKKGKNYEIIKQSKVFNDFK